MVELFKELQESLNKLSTLLIALIGALITDIGKSLLEAQHKLVMSLVFILVLYSFLVVFGTILQIYRRSIVPIINCALLLLGCAASFLAMSIISSTVAWSILTLWVGMFVLVVYDYVVHERMKNWIEGCIA